VFDLWWAYYQCEPFGSHWEQTANLASMIHANTAMMAATHGVKSELFGVIDFMPRDSMDWVKRKKRKRTGIHSPTAQRPLILQAFGFRQ
jgi:hypothetical protein